MADGVQGPDGADCGTIQPGRTSASRRTVAARAYGGPAPEELLDHAQHAGDTTPDGLQHLLGRAKWDADLVRDDLRALVLEHLADDQAVLVVDEVAVYLTYTSRHRHAAVDRALYLPKSWTSDPERCQQAAVPKDLLFATKPQLALQMIERALDTGVPAAWAAGDEVYGDNPKLRAAQERRQLGYVLAVSSTYRVPTPAGPQRADHLTKKIPKPAWRKLSVGRGAKGHRWYDWAEVALTTPGPVGQQHLLIRRNRRTGELACYRCYSPHPVPLSTLVEVAGSRWDGGGDFPELEDANRAGRALSPPLGLLASLSDPCPARTCLPCRHRHPRTR